MGIRADSLLRRSLLARGQITRGLRMSEIGMEELHQGEAIRFTVKKSKTNKFNRTLQAGVMRYFKLSYIRVYLHRHKDVNFCSVGALSLHLVERYHVIKERRPNLMERSEWYNTPILESNELSYTQQRDSVMDAFDKFNVDCSKKTHLGRDRGTADCSHGGVPKESMERQGFFVCTFFTRLGFWNLDSLTASYLCRTLPVDALKVLAGFEIQESYFITRDCIQPPQELLNQIFPWIQDLETECSQMVINEGSEHSGIYLLTIFII